jgi:hypothetical protein
MHRGVENGKELNKLFFPLEDFSKPNSGYGFKKSDNLRSKNHK